MTVSLKMFEVTGSWVSVSSPSLSGNNTGPKIESVEGLVTFTPRLPRGTAFFLRNYLVSVKTNTIQQIFLISNPTKGTWRLSLDGSKTVDLTHSASTAQVQSALEHLPSIGTGNVRVTTGASADSFDVEFIKALEEKLVPPLSAFGNLHNNAGFNCPIEVTTVYQGSPQVIGDVAVTLPAITGRIRRGRLCSIDSIDSVGVDLAANIPELNNSDPLIYDVSFSKVSFNGSDQTIAPFGFIAPADSTPVCITSPSLQKVPYSKPVEALWSPAAAPAAVGWRLRAV